MSLPEGNGSSFPEASGLTFPEASGLSFPEGNKSTNKRSSPRLPLEAGKPRVQRLVDELAPVHLETDVPQSARWTLRVAGLVEQPFEFDLAGLGQLGQVDRTIDFHCVWGWSRPDTRWRGVTLDALLAPAGPRSDATHVTFQAFGSPYDSCVPLDDARDGLIALELDGAPIPSIHGGPVRYVPPARLWGYKGVKWLGQVTLRDELVPGFWESKVGDVAGQVPEGVLALFDERRADRPEVV